jgi:hypothetical protein
MLQILYNAGNRHLAVLEGRSLRDPHVWYRLRPVLLVVDRRRPQQTVDGHDVAVRALEHVGIHGGGSVRERDVLLVLVGSRWELVGQ